jgi:cholinesterase
MAMSSFLPPRFITSLALVLSSLSVLAQASTYNAVIVYGDSLSDNGNLFAATGQPASPYFDGRMSNGPVAVEQLAALLGSPLLDYAWGGATTGIGNLGDGGTPTSFGLDNLPGMQTELAQTQASLGPYVSNGLFVVWGGPDDFLSPSPLDTTVAQIVARAVSDELGIVQSLRTLGAQHILVPGMPDLGLTPYFQSLPRGAVEGTEIASAFNAALVAGLPSGVTYFNTSALLDSIVANPAAYGFNDVTDPCYNGTTVCSDPSQYLFFDSFHPTTAADAFAAEGFREVVSPEPSTFVLLMVGGLVLGAVSRTRAPVVATARQATTQKKMKMIEDALLAFRTANDRIPCPADLTTALRGANLGIEGATPGTCTGGSPSANFTSGTAAEGAVPAVTFPAMPDQRVTRGASQSHQVSASSQSDRTRSGGFTRGF